jgi:hypothetical protein
MARDLWADLARLRGLTPSCGLGASRFASGWVGIALTAWPVTACGVDACAGLATRVQGLGREASRRPYRQRDGTCPVTGVFIRATGVTSGYIL